MSLRNVDDVLVSGQTGLDRLSYASEGSWSRKMTEDGLTELWSTLASLVRSSRSSIAVEKMGRESRVVKRACRYVVDVSRRVGRVTSSSFLPCFDKAELREKTRISFCH